MKKYSFPRIQQIEINHFSLFTKQSHIKIDASKKVFCLAGANGLGKSTFIAILNYALTGIVRHPLRDFSWSNSITKFYSDSKNFVGDYFNGRIDEDDRSLAQITLQFSVGEKIYKIRRGFFEPEELRWYERSDGENIDTLADNMSPLDINEQYKKDLAHDIGLSRFEQFVFLQSYILTFDETHQLLFWNERLMESALYLCFGVEPEKAELADELRKKVSSYDSDSRNIQYQITRTRKDLNNLLARIQGNKSSQAERDIFDGHKQLVQKQTELSSSIDQITVERKQTDLAIADNLLKISTLRSEYEKLFNQDQEEIPIEKHPEVVRLLRELKIKIFAEQDYTELLENLAQVIKGLRKAYPSYDIAEYQEQIKSIDNSLFALKKSTKSLEEKKERLLEEERAKNIDLGKVEKLIETIEEDNADILEKLATPSADREKMESLIESSRKQIEYMTLRKQEAVRNRDGKRKELDKLEEELNQKYFNAESVFVPIFNRYARNFVGLDMDLNMAVSSSGANLTLDINSQRRSRSFQLSESQRYFVDIALRMALLEFISNSGCLLVDTPEGSLDIAYESRAGKMFADFSTGDFCLFLTANINTSQLLLQLAEMCGNDNMQLERMTKWTTLSDVQQQEEAKIEDAFTIIEERLNGTGSNQAGSII